MRFFAAIITIILATNYLVWSAEIIRLEGDPFQPTAPVIWSHSATNIPVSLMLYKVVPHQFAHATLSNVLALASFTTKTMEKSPDKEIMSWRFYESEGRRLVRSLDVNPVQGHIVYHNYHAVDMFTNTAHGVPDREEVDALAMQYLERLGGDTNQLCFHPRTATEHTSSRFDKQAGKYVKLAVTMRGAMYARQMEGIRFEGPGWRGFAVDFGHDAQVSYLEMNWRNMEPEGRYQTFSPDEIIRQIEAGKSVLPHDQKADLDSLPNAKKLTVKAITPYYWSEAAGAKQEWLCPFAELEIVAELDGTNSATFYLRCPILTTNTISVNAQGH